jgi:uncharacterized protein YdaU (DUF1376 family)
LNFYKHHLGDYAAHTSHLTWDEDCAYRRLLDQYYKREAPLPADPKDACRLVRASTPAQRKATEAVLREFFSLRDDGWHQKRCDAEIEQASAQAETNRRIAEEREARKRARIVNESSTDSGERVVHESSTPTSGGREPSQTPDAKTPDSKKTKKKARVPALTVAELVIEGLTESTAAEWLSYREGKGASLTPLAWKGVAAEAIKAGWTYEQAVQKAMARGWVGFEAEWVRSDRKNGHADAETTWQRSQRERVSHLTGGLVSAKPPSHSNGITTTEVIDVTARALG